MDDIMNIPDNFEFDEHEELHHHDDSKCSDNCSFIADIDDSCDDFDECDDDCSNYYTECCHVCDNENSHESKIDFDVSDDYDCYISEDSYEKDNSSDSVSDKDDYDKYISENHASYKEYKDCCTNDCNYNHECKCDHHECKCKKKECKKDDCEKEYKKGYDCGYRAGYDAAKQEVEDYIRARRSKCRKGCRR